jgi:hypothetical protein
MNNVDSNEDLAEDEPKPEDRGRGHSHWLMVLCCIPMVVVAVALVASGTSLIPLVIALACAGMMAAMMLAMRE